MVLKITCKCNNCGNVFEGNGNEAVCNSCGAKVRVEKEIFQYPHMEKEKNSKVMKG